MKCAYHTNGVLYGTMGVLITLIKVWSNLITVYVLFSLMETLLNQKHIQQIERIQ